jgi:hypothetical protein
MKTPDKVYWSYLAGLFDGEGTFSIYQNHGNYYTTKLGEERQYNFTNQRVEITNTNIELMEWLIKNFGGVYYHHRRAKEIHKIAYSWRPKGKKNTEELILGILPYLVIKRKQAKLILEYIRLGQSCGTELKNVDRRKELMLECQALNKRGLSVTTNTLNADDESVMRESDLTGDSKSAPDVNQGSEIVSDLA